MDAARGMVESGDWLVPRYQGQAFFDKPVLTYWLMAASMGVLGPTTAAARLVPVLAALALVLATAWLGTLLFDRRSALAGALVLASTPAFLSFARMAMSDMLLALTTTASAALALRAYRAQPPPWLAPALGAVLGLGFLTKGPVALAVAGLALALILWRERTRPLPFGAAGLTLAAAAFAVLGRGWFALVFVRGGAEPLVYFFLRENLERFAGETYDAGRPLWFYLPAYLAEGLPWSCFLPLALVRLLRGDAGDGAGARWLALWAALVVALLSLSRGKIDYYLLPVYPPLSLLVGRYLAGVPWRELDRGWARTVLLLGAGATTLLLARPPALPPGWLPDPVHGPLLVVVATLVAVALLAAALRPTAPGVLLALASATAVGFLLAVTLFLPAFSAGQPNRVIAADVARERLFVPRAQLVYCDDAARVRRDVLFVARHAGIEQCDLWSLAASRAPYLFLVSPAQAASLSVLGSYRHVGSYPYLPASTLTLDGLLAVPDQGQVQLVANYPTTDPVADRKKRKEYRRSLQREWQELARSERP